MRIIALPTDALNATPLNASLGCILSMNKEGQVIEWSITAEQTFGYTSAEALGQSVSDLILPTAYRAGLDQYLKTGKAFTLNQRLRVEAQRRSGEVFPCELTIHPVLVKDGGPSFTAYLRDLTEQVRAQVRQDALCAVARNLGQAATPAQVVEMILREVMPSTDATRGSVGILTPEGDHLRLLGELKYDATVKAALDKFPLTLDIPGSHVVRTGQPVFGGRAVLEARFSALSRVGPSQLAAAAVLPLSVQGTTFGYLALVYDTPQAFGDAERHFLTAMSEQCALALHRAHLLEGESHARERLAFLAKAGEALASSLDLEATLARLAELAVPHIADWCAVYLPEGPYLHPHGLAHTNPEKVRVLREYVNETPVRIDSAGGTAEIYRSGAFLYFPGITPEMINALEVSAEQKARVHELGLRSYMGVPMLAHGQTVGVMSFALAETDRSFTPEDLNLALELGRRAGLALAHARLHQQLRESHATLEERVEERTRELEEQRRALERSNVELERFAYVASHDLQEPLRTIASFAELIEQRYAGSLDERGLRYLSLVIQGARRMKVLINDLLVFSRLNAVKDPLSPVLLDAALGEALDALHTAIAESGARITSQDLPDVLGVHSELIQVFQNLIGNALKFRRADVRPEIRIEAQRDGEGWRVQVQDNGIGFDPQYAEQIFQIFQRLHRRDQYEGTGMGLAVVQKILEHHGGRVWAQSEPGVGSTFSFTLMDAARDG
ncbi:ATP-binding protein [Deinococcus humi]|uniref:histidine kinase n=1 Tax=Deinococcus humi TaxID=662880 RepID=A0A7W8JV42_9DEIO|nr:ATP-binding protein [Deinococcus humi]MBB5363800.1 PAS domain S-box-containing protein [Deinococcus humi]GGO31940.1 hypothetical protein GCM10008949_28720 [Deinococcus humi]